MVFVARKTSLGCPLTSTTTTFSYTANRNNSTRFSANRSLQKISAIINKHLTSTQIYRNKILHELIFTINRNSYIGLLLVLTKNVIIIIISNPGQRCLLCQLFQLTVSRRLLSSFCFAFVCLWRRRAFLLTWWVIPFDVVEVVALCLWGVSFVACR